MFRVLGRTPAAPTASFQHSKHRITEYAVIPERPMNSECEGARPSFLAMLAMESMMCFLSDTSLTGAQVAQALLPVRVSKCGKFGSSEDGCEKLGVG
jgi:hypothetical protein